jgi:peptidoglycan/LPS O-acetylase OafA/YrhL
MTRVNISELLTQQNKTFNQAAVYTESRYHYLDNIRALAMFIGVLFHAALAYSPLLQDFWFTAGSENSILIDIVSLFTHLFRMPIFFLVSGFFTIMLIQKRGLSSFLKNRAMRILLPFIIFFPLLGAAIFIVIGWALENVENLSPMLQFIKSMQENPDAPTPPLSTMHLWFLFNLFLFALTTAALYKLDFFQSKIVLKIFSAKFIVFVLPLLMIPAMFTQPTPHPAAEKFYPELWSFGFYGLFFILGCFIFLKQSLLEELDPFKNKLLLVSLLAYAVFYYLLPNSLSLDELIAVAISGFEPTSSHIYTVICEVFIAVYMTIYCLLLGRKFLNKQNNFLKLISDSSYWVYLIHLPVLLMIQFALTDIEMNMWLKFFISTFTTLLIAMVSYLVLVRRTPIGWLLNGRKKKKLVVKDVSNE